MPTGLYDLGRQAFLDGDIDWSLDTIRVVFIDTSAYTVNLVAHQFLADVPAPARVGTPAALVNKTSTIGIADADDVVFVALAGPSCEAILIYKDTGLEATSRLIWYCDTGVGLPFQPGGTNVTLTWSAQGIFKL